MPTGVYIRTPEMLARAKANLAKGRSPEVRKKAVESIKKAWTDEKREAVSIKNKKRMHDPDVRKKHLAGLARSVKVSSGANFKGGNGQTPVEIVTALDRYLKPAGWIREYVVRTRGHTSEELAVPPGYKLDFGHPDLMVGIEVDGQSHRPFARRKKDEKKRLVLESLGWRIVRVKHR